MVPITTCVLLIYKDNYCVQLYIIYEDNYVLYQVFNLRKFSSSVPQMHWKQICPTSNLFIGTLERYK